MIQRFAQAYESAADEDLKRLCLAYLASLHPDYTTQYCEKILMYGVYSIIISIFTVLQKVGI
jgi:hypothetical protein